MKISLGSIEAAAMAYVSHITNHPSLCMFFLMAGAVGVVLAVFFGIVAGMFGEDKK